MKIGYARVSTKDQVTDLQVDALKAAGCEKIYIEHASGAKADRPELNKLMAELRKGDTLVIWKLDRLGRSIRHLIGIAEDLLERSIGLNTLSENIDTATASGKLLFNMLSSLAEFEKGLIRERTHAGLEAARKRGRKGGRPKGLSPEAKRKAMLAQALYKNKELTIKEICDSVKIAKSTLYKYLALKKNPAKNLTEDIGV